MARHYQLMVSANIISGHLNIILLDDIVGWYYLSFIFDYRHVSVIVNAVDIVGQYWQAADPQAMPRGVVG